MQDSSANAWMFENEHQSQIGAHYSSNLAHHPISENYGDTRRKIPHYRSSSTVRDGMSPLNQDIHAPSINQDRKHDDFITTSNYLADKPRMSLRER